MLTEIFHAKIALYIQKKTLLFASYEQRKFFFSSKYNREKF